MASGEAPGAAVLRAWLRPVVSAEVTAEPSSKDAAERRDAQEAERSPEATEATRPQALPGPRQGDSQAPGQEAPSPQPPASPTGHRPLVPQAVGDSEGPSQGLSTEQGPQTEREGEAAEAEAAEMAASEEGGPTTASDPQQSLSYKETRESESMYDGDRNQCVWEGWEGSASLILSHLHHHLEG